MNETEHQPKTIFSRFARWIAAITGRPKTFGFAVLIILIWAVTGPLFAFSQTWQLVVNTATTIVTFLMVFVLQNSQNRDGEALQAKLDELIISSRGADNRFVGAEQLSDQELKDLRALLVKQAAAAEDELEERAEARAGRAA